MSMLGSTRTFNGQAFYRHFIMSLIASQDAQYVHLIHVYYVLCLGWLGVVWMDVCHGELPLLSLVPSPAPPILLLASPICAQRLRARLCARL
jgi:hypothetical protein